MNIFKNRSLSLVLGFFLATALISYAAFTNVNWWQVVDTPTTLSGYGITDAASDTELTNHAALTITHGADSALVGATSSVALENKTLTNVNNHISGTVIDSGTVAEARIDAAICRDSELSAHSASQTSVHGLPASITNSKYLHTSSGGVMEWSDAPTSATFKRAEKSLDTGATSTVTFGNDVEGNAVAIGTFGKCTVLLNGVAQKYSNFTKTSATVIESTQGDMASGTLVTLMQVD